MKDLKDEHFLKYFDHWVEYEKVSSSKIDFPCSIVEAGNFLCKWNTMRGKHFERPLIVVSMNYTMRRLTS